MKGLSEKEMEIVAHLEFEQKYFFTMDDIKKFFSSYNQRRHTLHKLIQKGRIVKLNRSKYFLVPVKARTGKWSDHPFIIIDEICDGEGYFIGGWAAANYWRLTDQIPMWREVYTTKRQGKTKILNTGIIFRRTTKKKIARAVVEEVKGHQFRIQGKEDSRRWMKSRS